MIYAHVPQFFTENTLPLLAIVNLGIEILPSDVNIVHYFPDEFVSLAILPPLNDETQVNVPVEEDTEVILEENNEAMDETGSEVEVTKVTPAGSGMRNKARSSSKVKAGPGPASKKAKKGKMPTLGPTPA